MISYRKVGGLHWLSLGRLRVSWCVKRREGEARAPVVKPDAARRVRSVALWDGRRVFV